MAEVNASDGVRPRHRRRRTKTHTAHRRRRHLVKSHESQHSDAASPCAPSLAETAPGNPVAVVSSSTPSSSDVKTRTSSEAIVTSPMFNTRESSDDTTATLEARNALCCIKSLDRSPYEEGSSSDSLKGQRAWGPSRLVTRRIQEPPLHFAERLTNGTETKSKDQPSPACVPAKVEVSGGWSCCGNVQTKSERRRRETEAEKRAGRDQQYRAILQNHHAPVVPHSTTRKWTDCEPYLDVAAHAPSREQDAYRTKHSAVRTAMRGVGTHHPLYGGDAPRAPFGMRNTVAEYWCLPGGEHSDFRLERIQSNSPSSTPKSP